MKVKTNIFYLLLFSMSLSACTKAVPVVELFSKPEGLTLENQKLQIDENVPFVLSGTCITEVQGIEISFDQGETWENINSQSNITEVDTQCSTSGTFQFKINQTLAQLKTTQAEASIAKIYLRGLWVKGVTEEVIAQIEATAQTGPPTISISTDQNKVSEGNSFTVHINLTTAATQPITVDLSSANLTAINSTHYTFTDQTIEFSAGQSSKLITVSTINTNPGPGDSACDPDREFKLQLANPTNATLSNTFEQILIVEDNDLPTLTVSPAPTITEGSGSIAMTINMDRKCASKAVSFEVNAISATATAEVDFILATGNKIKTIAANTSTLTHTIPITIIDDNIDEENETFEFRITQATNAFIDSSASIKIATIIDNDAAPTIAFETTASFVDEGSSVTSNVRLSHPSSKPITFRLIRNSAGSTTDPASDYSLTKSGDSITLGTTLTIPAGITVFPVTLTATNDAIFEVADTLKLEIDDSPTNATLGGSSWHTFTINLSDNSIPMVNNRTYYVLANDTIDIYADSVLHATAPSIGSDADGQTLSIQSVGGGYTKGTVNISGSKFTYAANATQYGIDTLLVTISDGVVTSSAAQVQIKIVHPFTWTGNSNNNWNNSLNWCGNIKPDHSSCENASGNLPAFSNQVYIDDTCNSANCTPIISTTPSAIHTLVLSKSGIILYNYSLQTVDVILASENAGALATISSASSSNHIEVTDNLIIKKHGAIGDGIIKVVGATSAYIKPEGMLTANIPSLHLSGTVQINSNLIQNGDKLEIDANTDISYLNDAIEYKIMLTDNINFKNDEPDFYFNNLKLHKVSSSLFNINYDGSYGFNTKISFICDAFSSPIQYYKSGMIAYSNIHQGNVTHKNAGCKAINAEMKTELNGNATQMISSDNGLIGNLLIEKSAGLVKLDKNLTMSSAPHYMLEMLGASILDLNGFGLTIPTLSYVSLDSQSKIIKNSGDLIINGNSAPPGPLSNGEYVDPP